MKTTLFLALGLLCSAVFAQKPIRLLPKSKNHTISMEYKDDILYFSPDELADFLHKKEGEEKSNAYAEVIKYAKFYDGEIAYKPEDTNFKNVSDRNLHKTLVEFGPAMLAKGKASDMIKATGKFNLAVMVKPCDNDPKKNLVTEKKGRVIFGCE